MSARSRRVIGAAVLLGVFLAQGCRIHRKKVPGAEVPLPLPETAAEQKEEPPAAAKELPPPPEIQPAPRAPGPAPVTETATVPAPPPKPKRAKARTSSRTAREPAPRSETAAAEAPTTPRLTQILTEEERWAYSKQIDDGLVRINEILQKVEGRPLTEDQTLVLNRVRAFLRQVNDTRKTDLVTARSLLERAELLAADLERTTH